MRACRIVVLTLSLVATQAAPATAADLSRHTPLGAVFAAPPPRVVIVQTVEPPPPVIGIPVKVPGYYGGYDTTYRNYYGTSPVTIFSRLPYACKWHGLC